MVKKFFITKIFSKFMLKLLMINYFFMKTEFLQSHSMIKEIYGQHLHEYLLVVNPAASVYEKVMIEKQLFREEYEGGDTARTNPHIVVAVFFAKEAMEETLIRWIQRICNQQQSFTATLNNYSGFPPHTIYLRVQNERPFQKLITDMKVVNAYISSCACPPMQFISKPHVSITEKISEDVYFEALIRYAHRTFHESFAVNELQLLKRKHEYDVLKPINIFRLLPRENPTAVSFE
jgi:2'-5' RNA ligase